jgi:hypothetical protein
MSSNPECPVEILNRLSLRPKFRAKGIGAGLPNKVVWARAWLAVVGLSLATGCSMLPISVQTKAVAARLGMANAELATIVQRTASGHNLEAHWVAKRSGDAIEVGMGRTSTSLSVVVRRTNESWGEDPNSRVSWSTEPSWGPQPPYVDY